MFRRPTTAVSALVAMALSVASARAEVTLRTLADAHGLKIGAMILDASWETPFQQEFVSSQFNAATVGTYWLRTHSEATTYNWSLTDRAVAWAAEAKMAIHLHPLLYPADQFNPAWVLASDPGSASSILQSHITTAVERYRANSAFNPTSGIVWDVVNEAVAPNGQYRDTWWTRNMPAAVGAVVPEYVIKAFEFARAADPLATLLYTDHDIELTTTYHTNKWVRVQEIVTELAHRGLIDGVGWEMHVTPEEVLGSTYALDQRMAWVKALGLKNFVTELDMTIAPGDPALVQQGAAYQRVAETWLAEGNGGWFQTWGVYDKYTWLGSDTRPLLFDENYAPKPAYHGVFNAVVAAVPETNGFLLMLAVGALVAVRFLKR